MSQNGQPSHIEIRGARVHNLKNIDIDIPLHQFVGIAGVSGSGKSSLALGILYAEGSRRYLEALSTYTRRRMTFASEADIDSIEYVPAALALHQRPATPDIRSTFGTSTELLNSVRLMFSRLGSHLCPNGHLVPPSANTALGKALTCPQCGVQFWAPGAESMAFNSDGACPQCGGTGVIRTINDDSLIPDGSKTLEEGAVAAWNQFGTKWMYRVAGELGVRLNVPYKNLTAEEKQIVLHGEDVKRLIAIPTSNGRLVELNCRYLNAHAAIHEGLKKATSEKGLVKINRFLTVGICPSCHGTRLSERIRSSQLCGLTLPEVCALPLDQLTAWIQQVPSHLQDEKLQAMGESIVRQYMAVARRLMELGLSYLTMDRAGSTLSTGERQRVQLARAVRNRTTGVLYILDEPSVGLHPSNMDGLLGVIHDLCDHGNSVVMVDHDVRMLRHADYVIELGPGSGTHGGRLLTQGTVRDVEKNPHSLIGGFLSGEETVQVRTPCDENHVFDEGTIFLKTRPLHTVKALSVAIPRGRFTCVTGVSGSGKTTLILESLLPALTALIEGTKLPSHIVSVEADGIHRCHLIDASPIGTNVRSTVATYSSVMDDLRKEFAALPSACQAGLTAADFSYNTGSLRCAECDGTGEITMDVQFLPDVTITCPTCHGCRYADSARHYRLFSTDENRGISLPDMMGYTLQQLVDLLPQSDASASIRRIRHKLETLCSLGIGYLSLGEGTPLLSGGEAQRLKLAAEMGRTQSDAVYVFDEPTIGLHPLDVRRLIHVFDQLTSAGATVIVIEHDVDMMVNADYCIDLGPGGGNAGGQIIYTGIPKGMIQCTTSVTGHYLPLSDQAN